MCCIGFYLECFWKGFQSSVAPKRILLLIRAWHCNYRRTLFWCYIELFSKMLYIEPNKHVLYKSEEPFDDTKNALIMQSSLLVVFTKEPLKNHLFLRVYRAFWNGFYMAAKRVFLLFWCQAFNNGRTLFGAILNIFKKVLYRTIYNNTFSINLKNHFTTQRTL